MSGMRTRFEAESRSRRGEPTAPVSSGARPRPPTADQGEGEPWHWTSAARRSSARCGPPGWRAVRTPTVAIVGGGLSGLATAIQLVRSGVRSFTVIEQSDGVGGTWRDNTYPGPACDVPSHLYSFSFAPKTDWTRRFAEQPEILSYAEDLVERYHLRSPPPPVDDRDRGALRRGSRDLAARPAAGPTGTEELEADTVVFACGQLNRPHLPDIEGVDTFAGPSWHSARWDHTRRRVGRTGGRHRIGGQRHPVRAPGGRRRRRRPPSSSGAPTTSGPKKDRPYRSLDPAAARAGSASAADRATGGGSTGPSRCVGCGSARTAGPVGSSRPCSPRGSRTRWSSDRLPTGRSYPTTPSGASASSSPTTGTRPCSDPTSRWSTCRSPGSSRTPW